LSITVQGDFWGIFQGEKSLSYEAGNMVFVKQNVFVCL